MNNDELKRDLERYEGKRNDLYCDACGKPWMECMGRRENWLKGLSYMPKSNDDWAGAMDHYSICPGGNPTIGVGINLAHGITDEEADTLLEARIGDAETAVDNAFDWHLHNNKG